MQVECGAPAGRPSCPASPNDVYLGPDTIVPDCKRGKPKTRSGLSRIAVLTAYGVVIGVAVLAVSCRTPGQTQSLPGSAGSDGMFALGYELFMAHCAACHGSRGRGDGPAAIALPVRPRNFWNEPNRYVSTLNGVATPDDLEQTIRSGRHFGMMPSRPYLTEEEVQVLAQYVREINRLAWVERLTKEFGDDEDTTPEEIEEIAVERVTPGEVVTEGWHGSGSRRNLRAGRKLFLENCASCHGPSGEGDGLEMPVDEQGKPIKVRDLTSGKLRGGTSDDEVFRRIRCGIPGTPMSSAIGLTTEEVWQLVHYVRFLGR